MLLQDCGSCHGPPEANATGRCAESAGRWARQMVRFRVSEFFFSLHGRWKAARGSGGWKAGAKKVPGRAVRALMPANAATDGAQHCTQRRRDEQKATTKVLDDDEDG